MHDRRRHQHRTEACIENEIDLRHLGRGLRSPRIAHESGHEQRPAEAGEEQIEVVAIGPAERDSLIPKDDVLHIGRQMPGEAALLAAADDGEERPGRIRPEKPGRDAADGRGPVADFMMRANGDGDRMLVAGQRGEAGDGGGIEPEGGRFVAGLGGHGDDLSGPQFVQHAIAGLRVVRPPQHFRHRILDSPPCV